MVTESLEATVSARVPEELDTAIETHVADLRKSGMRVTEADIIRMSLTEYFRKRKIKVGKNGRSNGQ